MGEYVKYMFYIVDEVSGLFDKVIDVMEGVCIEDDNCFLMFL